VMTAKTAKPSAKSGALHAPNFSLGGVGFTGPLGGIPRQIIPRSLGVGMSR
jgi:hypothetical protein